MHYSWEQYLQNLSGCFHLHSGNDKTDAKAIGASRKAKLLLGALGLVVATRLRKLLLDVRQLAQQPMHTHTLGFDRWC